MIPGARISIMNDVVSSVPLSRSLPFFLSVSPGAVKACRSIYRGILMFALLRGPLGFIPKI